MQVNTDLLGDVAKFDCSMMSTCMLVLCCFVLLLLLLLVVVVVVLLQGRLLLEGCSVPFRDDGSTRAVQVCSGRGDVKVAS